jgi:hypothetical protein
VKYTTSFWTAAVAAGLAIAVAQWPVAAERGQQLPSTAQSSPLPRPCRMHGRVVSGDQPLPGVSVVATLGVRAAGATSTDVDGTYVMAVPVGDLTVHVELPAFAAIDRAVRVSDSACDVALDLALALASRVPGARPSGAVADTSAQTPAPSTETTAAAPTAGRRGGAAATQGPQAGARGNQAGARGTAAPRFQALAVQQASGGAEDGANDTAVGIAADDPAARLLPPGFSTDAPLESVAVSGTMVEIDRGLLNDRLQALGRGEFDLADGVDRQAPGDAAAAVGIQGGGRGAGGGFGGRGGLGGRIGGANRVQVSANYGLGSSAFDSAPYALRADTESKRDYLQQTFSTTIGGPLKIPHLYDGTRRTTFNFSYSGNRNGDLFDQYATVPDDAYRTGNFAGSGSVIVDPLTGQPFSGNQIPASRIDPAAASLLGFLPEASLPGDTRNARSLLTQHSTTDAVTLRLTHSFTQPPAGRGGRGAGGRGGFGGGGRGGRGNFQAPLNVTHNATVNYRRNDGDRPNVFPLLSGRTNGSTMSVPITLNVRKGRAMHAFSFTFNRTASETLNAFAFQQDIAAQAGINGVATDPFDWGVPNLTFGGFTSIRDTAPSRRNDRSLQVGYTFSRILGTHNIRLGGTYNRQADDTQSDANPRGSYTFTGLYTSGGVGNATTAQAFADFLLGLPQQATRQYSVDVDQVGTPVGIRGDQFGVYVQDDWRLRGRWTVNYGLRYDVVTPYRETNGHMVNLDAAPDFSAVARVESGGVGPFSGQFPAALVNTDWNNLAPRAGVAWRATNRSVVRFGYGLSYNSGSYAAIARQLYQQPDFFSTATTIGTIERPLTLESAFAAIAPSTITNNYGIDKNYQLGLIHQWNVDYSHDLFRSWNGGVTYIGTLGSHLDMLRAPNRGPDGLRIAGVQSFTWQSSEGASRMRGLSFRVQKRQTHGVSGSASYTWSRSRDDTTATGGGATVAQDDRNLGAEWALSNFDRRHQFNGTLDVELPWGRNRKWLSEGGWLASLVGDWSMAANLTWQSGTPLTVRCSTCASDVARGTGGTLRADYLGGPILLADPTADRFFNTDAFAIPAAGTFGSSLRNIVTGPGSHQVNARFTRDVALGRNRSVSVNVNATNLLNTVNFAAIDTNVNSPTFGEVLSVRGMRTVRLNLRFRF